MKNVRILVVIAAFLISGIVFSCSKKNARVMELGGQEKIPAEETEISGSSPWEDGGVLQISGQTTGADENAVNATGESTDIPEVNAADRDSNASGQTGKTADIPYAGYSPVTVYVCGAVRNSGVYVLPEGSRVTDAIDASGGFAENADDTYLNLACILIDGTRVYVPETGETAEAGFAAKTESIYTDGNASPDLAGIHANESISRNPNGLYTNDGTGRDAAAGAKVNLNTATAEQLKTLNGIGDARAKAIIDYREMNGFFKSIEEIKLVPGIKDAAFEKICEDIEV